jgi:hypothetical protein
MWDDPVERAMPSSSEPTVKRWTRRASFGALLCVAAVGCNAIFGTDDLRYDRADSPRSTTSFTGTAGSGGAGGAGGGAPDACADGELGPQETDVDCGAKCPPCPNGLHCGEAADCQSRRCPDGVCAPCASPDDCESFEDCKLPDGVCQGRTPNGEPCAASAECASGFCSLDDAVCCDTPCILPCESCLAAKTGAPDGACAFVDPELNPDPDGECPASDPVLCGSDGSGCAGDATSCRLWSEGTVCQPAGCESGSEYTERTCDGAGTCIAAESSFCSPYVCGASSCRTSCSLHTHCVNSYYCASNTCTPRLNTGASCSFNEQCMSGVCSGNSCT